MSENKKIVPYYMTYPHGSAVRFRLNNDEKNLLEHFLMQMQFGNEYTFDSDARKDLMAVWGGKQSNYITNLITALCKLDILRKKTQRSIYYMINPAMFHKGSESEKGFSIKTFNERYKNFTKKKAKHKQGQCRKQEAYVYQEGQHSQPVSDLSFH